MSDLGLTREEITSILRLAVRGAITYEAGEAILATHSKMEREIARLRGLLRRVSACAGDGYWDELWTIDEYRTLFAEIGAAIKEDGHE